MNVALLMNLIWEFWLSIAAVLKCIPTCSQIYSLDEFSFSDKLRFSFFFLNVIYVAEFLFR